MQEVMCCKQVPLLRGGGLAVDQAKNRAVSKARRYQALPCVVRRKQNEIRRFS